MGRAGSLRTRLAAALILTAVLSAALVGLAGIRLIRQAEQGVALAELRRQALALSEETALIGAQPAQTLRLFRRALRLSEAAAYRIGPRGNASLIGGETRLALAESDIQQLMAGGVIEGVREIPGEDVIFVAQPLQARRGNLFVVLSRPAELGVASLPLAGPLITAGALAVAVAMAAAYILSKRIANPMLELASASRDLAEGNLARRVTLESNDEIGEVGKAFNRMAEALQRDEERERGFLMSISHELRTPLTAIQGYAEAIEDGAVSGEKKVDAARVIVAESKRLTRLVSDLLDLAHLDARRFIVAKEPVDVPTTLEAVRRSFLPRAAEAGLQVSAQPTEGTVLADQDRLVQILSNLVDNALRYTPSGGSIKLISSTSDGLVRISVADTGPGFQPEDLEHAFERQYLWRKYRGVRESGTGLGLVICQELAEIMGGRITAANGPAGGAVFTVEMPAGT